MSNPIYLRFIRKTCSGVASPDPRTDDTLKILKMGENKVKTIYTEVLYGDLTIDSQILTYQQLHAYLCRIFWLVSIDSDPFASVQFCIPGHPVILIETGKVQQNSQMLLEILASVYTAWPFRRVSDSAPPTAPTPSVAAPQ